MRRLHDDDTDALALVAHELRVPLVSLLAFMEQLASEEEVPSEARVAYARGAAALGRKMLQRLGELQAVVRAETGHVDVARKPCTLGTALGEAMEDLGPGAWSDIPVDGDAIAFGDAELMRQALAALVAAMSSDPGGVATIDTRVEHDKAVMTISRARPIPASELDRMLLPFGPLGVARWLVEAQDGEMDIHSSPATGTRVKLRMPLAFQANPLLSLSVRPGRLVLAVDDDDAAFDLYERALSPQGFRVVGTTRSHLAAALEEARPDVMVLAGMSFDPSFHPSIPAVAIDRARSHPSFGAELGEALTAAFPTRVPTTKRGGAD